MLQLETPPPLVAAIHDMSGFGRCSLTVALPILSVMGAQCCPLPTALLSNHTGYESFYFMDFTDKMPAYYEQWLKLKLNFAAIYSGFLGSEKQVELVEDFIKTFRQLNQTTCAKPPLVIVDPVMGDHGNIYTTYTQAMCQKMKHLVTFADIITPNLTEACLLLEKPYIGNTISLEDAKAMAVALADLGPKIPVLTGLNLHHQGKVANLAYNSKTQEFFLAEETMVPQHFTGTGDIFASVLCGGLVNGLDTKTALNQAASFVHKCAKYTAQHQGQSNDGVMLEKLLHHLIS